MNRTQAVVACGSAVIEQQVAFEYLVGRRCEFLSESPRNASEPPNCSLKRCRSEQDKTAVRDAVAASCTRQAVMAQFTLDPEALAGKYEALREDVQGDRDVMHKRIATLEELNKEAHRKYAELQKKAHELQQQVVFAKAGVPTTAKGIPMMTDDESLPPERRERSVVKISHR